MKDSPRIASDSLDALFTRVEKGAARAGCAAQVAIAVEGELVGFRTFGRARHGDGHEREADDLTLFSIFSVTKAMTSAAFWILLQEERVALSDPVVKHIPEFGSHGKENVRVEQLLTHTSGFPEAQLPAEDWADPSLRLQHFANWHLVWEPGSRFAYHSSASMWVLAELITRIADVDYREFIRSRVFEPLGLRNLFIGLPPEQHSRVAEVVVVGEPATDRQRAASPVDAPVIGEATLGHANRAENRAAGSPGGGAIGNAADVALFYQGLMADAEAGGRGIWQPGMLRDAWTVRNPEFIVPMTGHAALRGLGVVLAGEHDKMWRGFAEDCAPRTFGHMGAGGQISWADPTSRLSFSFCTNGAERDPVRQGANGFKLSSLAAACVSIVGGEESR
ncbi:MAG: beta-lactamase family protein [bacterium]|nr:beta-lactamase family protein [bacterium]